MNRFALLILVVLVTTLTTGCLTPERSVNGITGTTPYEGGEMEAVPRAGQRSGSVLRQAQIRFGEVAGDLRQ